MPSPTMTCLEGHPRPAQEPSLSLVFSFLLSPQSSSPLSLTPTHYKSFVTVLGPIRKPYDSLSLGFLPPHRPVCSQPVPHTLRLHSTSPEGSVPTLGCHSCYMKVCIVPWGFQSLLTPTPCASSFPVHFPVKTHKSGDVL